jgi:predicted deacylase
MPSTIRTVDAARPEPFIRRRSTPNPGRVVAGFRLLALSLLLALSAFALSPVPSEAFSEKDVRSILTYDEMMTRLQRIATRGQDVRLSEAPYRAKTTGRALPVITVGQGPRTVFITAMQHANEYRVSDAAVAIAEKLSRRRSAWMRSELTVVIMPRVNVDGFDHTLLGEPWRGLPWRFNVDATAVGFTGPYAAILAQVLYPFAITGVGYNVNRYHPMGLTEDPGAPTQPNPVPETLAVRHVFDQVRPSIMLDMHEQPSDAGNVEGRPVDVALAWTAPSLGVAPGVLAQEKRIAYAAYLANPTKRTGLYSFPPSDAPGQAHNRYGLLGVPSLLVEFRGLDCWTEADGGAGGVFGTCQAGGDPSNRAAERLAKKTVLSVLESVADGSVDLIDSTLADQHILPYQTTFPVGTRDDH